MVKNLTLCVLLVLSLAGNANGHLQTVDKQLNNQRLIYQIDSLLKQGYEGRLFPGASMVLLKDDSLVFFNYGQSNIKNGNPVTSETLFQLGSVGKLLTAISVLQLVDSQKIDMNTDVSNYLGDLRLDLDYPITLHCLLTHSCGFNDVNIGYMAENSENVLPLHEFIKQYNPRLFQAPLTDITYSNYSYALAGLVVEKVSGLNFKEYVQINIFNKLAMANSTLNFPEGYDTNNKYAVGYNKSREGFQATLVYPRHATPAGSLVSNAQDMSILIKALLDQDSTLLSDKSWDLFYDIQFSSHSKLNGYSYGLEQQNINGIESWAKGGMLPGMLSHVLIIPDEMAIFLTMNTSHDNFGELFFEWVFDTLYPSNAELKSQISSNSIEKYAGTYRDKRYNRNTEENIVSLFRGSFDLYANSTQDTLFAYHNSGWHDYILVEKGIIQEVENPENFIAFKENENGEILNMYRNLNIGGLTIPTSYEKTKWYNGPEFINEYYAFIPFMVFSGLLFSLASMLIRLIRLRKLEYAIRFLLRPRFHLIFGLTVVLTILHSILVPFKILTQVNQFLLGYPLSFQIFSALGYLLIPLALLFIIELKNIWKTSKGNLFTRLYLTIVALSLVLHLVFLEYWNFL